MNLTMIHFGQIVDEFLPANLTLMMMIFDQIVDEFLPVMSEEVTLVMNSLQLVDEQVILLLMKMMIGTTGINNFDQIVDEFPLTMMIIMMLILLMEEEEVVPVLVNSPVPEEEIIMEEAVNLELEELVEFPNPNFDLPTVGESMMKTLIPLKSTGLLQIKIKTSDHLPVLLLPDALAPAHLLMEAEVELMKQAVLLAAKNL